MYLIDPIILKRDKFDASGYFGTKKERNIYIYIYIIPTDMIQSIKFFLIKNLKTKKQKMNTTSPSNCIVVCFDSLLIVDE